MNCELSNHEMRELVQLMRQRPILPNIVYIWWIEDNVGSIPDMDKKHLKLLLQTFRDTFPDLELEADE